MIGYPVWDACVIAGETAAVESPVVSAGWVDVEVDVEDELVAAGVEELVELDPHADRTKIARTSKMPIVAFEIVMMRDECIIRIILSSRFLAIDLPYFLKGTPLVTIQVLFSLVPPSGLVIRPVNDAGASSWKTF